MKKKTALVVAGVVISFVGLVFFINLLFMKQILGREIALLMTAALLGIYVGVGVLIIVYRLVSKLD